MSRNRRSRDENCDCMSVLKADKSCREEEKKGGDEKEQPKIGHRNEGRVIYGYDDKVVGKEEKGMEEE